MVRSDLSYDGMRERLADFEAILDALRAGRMGAVAGNGGTALLRLAETERKLGDSESRLQTVLEAARGSVYERAVASGDAGYHSERWAEMLGYRDDEVPPHDWLSDWFFKRVHPDDRGKVQRAYEAFLEGETDRYDVEMRVRHKLGHWVWSHDVARALERDPRRRVRRLAGMMFDITGRKRAELALHENAARFRLLFERNPDGVFALDSAARFLQANPACERMTGYAPAELLQTTFLDICAPDQRHRAAAHFERAFHDPVRLDFETALIRKDGKRIDIAVAGEPVLAEGAVTSVYCAARDIAERHAAEEGLHQRNATLERQVAARAALAEQRARDLRRMAAELSHAEHRERRRMANLLHDELQPLLIAVKLHLPALARANPTEREQQIAKLEALLIESIATSRNLTQELSPLVLQMGTVVDAVRWLGTWFHEKHGLTVAIEAQDIPPHIPEHLRVFLFQSVRELLFNVIKHSGSLEARVELAAQDGCLTVRVDDSGEDFDPEAVLARFQEPEGFGLFNIRERVDALGGCLTVEATPRGGARFQLVAPLDEDALAMPDVAEPARPAQTARAAAVRQAKAGPIRLLLADDHAVVREGLVGLLERYPEFLVVGEAADGEQAIHQADALRPDVILMDVDMPTMGGIDATGRIKRSHPDIAIVGLSFHDDEVVARTMLSAGADRYVSKHSSAKDLVAAIRAACLPRRNRGVGA